MSTLAHILQCFASIGTILEHAAEEFLMLDVFSARRHEDDRTLRSKGTVERGLQEVHVTLGIDADVVNREVLAAESLVRSLDVLSKLCLEFRIQVGRALLVLSGGPAGCVALCVGVELVARQTDLLIFIDEELDGREDADRAVVLLDAGDAQLAAERHVLFDY